MSFQDKWGQIDTRETDTGFATPQTPAGISGQLPLLGGFASKFNAAPVQGQEPVQSAQPTGFTGPIEKGSPLSFKQRATVSTAETDEGREAIVQNLGFETLRGEDNELLIRIDDRVYRADEEKFSLKDLADLFGPGLTTAGALIGTGAGLAVGGPTIVGAPAAAYAGAAAGGGIAEGIRQKMATKAGAPSGDAGALDIVEESLLGLLAPIGIGKGGTILSKVGIRAVTPEMKAIATTAVKEAAEAGATTTVQKRIASQTIESELRKTFGQRVAAEAAEGFVGGAAQGAAQGGFEQKSLAGVAQGALAGAGIGTVLGAGIGTTPLGRVDAPNIPARPDVPPGGATSPRTQAQLADEWISGFKTSDPEQVRLEAEKILDKGRTLGVEQLDETERAVFEFYSGIRPAKAVASKFGQASPEGGFAFTPGREAELNAFRDEITRRIEGERFIGMTQKGKELLLKRLAAEGAQRVPEIKTAEDIAGILSTGDAAQKKLADEVMDISRRIKAVDEGIESVDIPVRREVDDFPETNPVAGKINSAQENVQYFDTPHRGIFIEKNEEGGLAYRAVRINDDGTVEALAGTKGARAVPVWSNSFDEASSLARTLSDAEAGGTNVTRVNVDPDIKRKLTQKDLTSDIIVDNRRLDEFDTTETGEDAVLKSATSTEQQGRYDSYRELSPEHAATLDRLDNLVNNNTLLPQTRDIIVEMTRETDAKLLGKISDLTAQSKTAMFRETRKRGVLGRYAPVRKDIRFIKNLSKEQFDLAVFFHEFGHAADDVVLDATERQVVRNVYDGLNRKELQKFFEQGPLPGTARHTAKDYKEFLAQSFAEYLLTDRAPSEAMRPLLERLAIKFVTALRSLLKRSDPEWRTTMEPIFRKMIAGDPDLPLSKFTDNLGDDTFRNKLRAMLGDFSGKGFVDDGVAGATDSAQQSSDPFLAWFDRVNKTPAQRIDVSAPEDPTALTGQDKQVNDALERAKAENPGPLPSKADVPAIENTAINRLTQGQKLILGFNFVMPMDAVTRRAGASGTQLANRTANYYKKLHQLIGPIEQAGKQMVKDFDSLSDTQRTELVGIMRQNAAHFIDATGGTWKNLEEIQAQTNDPVIKKFMEDLYNNITKDISEGQIGRSFGEDKIARKSFPFWPEKFTSHHDVDMTEEEFEKALNDVLNKSKWIPEEWSEEQKRDAATNILLGQSRRGRIVSPGAPARDIDTIPTTKEFEEGLEQFINRQAQVSARIQAFTPPNFTLAKGKSIDAAVTDFYTKLKAETRNDLRKLSTVIPKGDKKPQISREASDRIIGNMLDDGTGFDRIFGVNLPKSTVPEPVRVMNRLQAFRLGLSAPANLVGGMIGSLMRSDLPSFMKTGFSTFLEPMTGARSWKDMLEYARKVGALEGGVYEGESANKIIEAYLTGVGFRPTEFITRIFSSQNGVLMAAKYADDAVNNLATRGQSKKWVDRLVGGGFDPEKAVLNEIDIGGKKLKTYLTQQQADDAAFQFTKDSQAGYFIDALPAFASTPWGRILTKFKTVAYIQTSNLVRETFGQIMRPGGDKIRGYRNLALLTSVVPLGGAGVEAFKNFLYGRDDADDRNFLEKWVQRLAAVNGYGVFADLMNSMMRGKGGVNEFVTGPTLNNVFEGTALGYSTASDFFDGEFSKAGERAAIFGTKQFGGAGTIVRERTGLGQ